MSHLNDLATELAAAEDRFAAGDIEAGRRASSLATTLAREANRTATRLDVAVDHAEMDAKWKQGAR